MAILYKCKVIDSNYCIQKVDDSAFAINGKPYEHYGNYMKLELSEEYDASKFSFGILTANGLKGRIWGPRRPNELTSLLNN